MKTDLYKSYFDISFQYVYLFECSLIYIHDLKLKSKKDFFILSHIGRKKGYTQVWRIYSITQGKFGYWFSDRVKSLEINFYKI